MWRNIETGTGMGFTELDIQIFYSINGLVGQWPELDALMNSLARPDTYLIPAIVTFAWWFWRQRRQAVISVLVLAALILAADAVGAGVKQIVARPRPCRVLRDAKPVVGCGRASAFPSNHAVNTTAAGTFLHMLYPKAGYVVWPMIALVGFNRVYVGAHYPSDVLGGWVLGSTGGWIAAVIFRRKRRLTETNAPQALAQSSVR